MGVLPVSPVRLCVPRAAGEIPACFHGQRLSACAGLLVESFKQAGRFPTYCPGGTQPPPQDGFTVDKYSTINVEEISINNDLSWYSAGDVSWPSPTNSFYFAPFGAIQPRWPHRPKDE